MKRILVCAATRAEHDACRRGILASAQSGVEMLFTGVGPVRAARSLAERLGTGPLPDLVVSAGLAGAASPTLALSSWITGIRIDEWDGAARMPVEGVVLAPGPPGLVRCDVVSVGALVTGALVLSEGADPVAVDMESAALARQAGLRGVAFTVARLISDTPSHPLPSFLAPFASALSATTAASRLSFAGRGLRGAIGDPRGVVRLARESATWLRALEVGWQDLARWPVA